MHPQSSGTQPRLPVRPRAACAGEPRRPDGTVAGGGGGLLWGRGDLLRAPRTAPSPAGDAPPRGDSGPPSPPRPRGSGAAAPPRPGPPRRRLIDEPRAFEERAIAPKPLQSPDFSSSSAAWELCMFRHFSHPDSFLYQKTCSLELIGHPPPLPPRRRRRRPPAPSTPWQQQGELEQKSPAARQPQSGTGQLPAPPAPSPPAVPFTLYFQQGGGVGGLLAPEGLLPLQPARHPGSRAGAPAKGHPPSPPRRRREAPTWPGGGRRDPPGGGRAAPGRDSPSPPAVHRDGGGG